MLPRQIFNVRTPIKRLWILKSQSITKTEHWLCCKNCCGIELLNNNSHGLSPPSGLVSPCGGFLSLLCDQGLHFASIKLCLALSHQGAIIKISVVRCHCLLCLGAQYLPLKRARILYQFVRTKGYLRSESLCTRTCLPLTKQFY